MNADAIRMLHAYNRWAHAQVWTCVDALSDADFTREFEYSIGSIRNHLVHLLSVDRRWFARVMGAELPARLDPAAFPTRAAVRTLWDAEEATSHAYLEAVTDAALQEVIEYDLPHRGGLKRDARWQILVHVVNHGTDHRAQILSLLYNLGAPTIEQDLVGYLWQ